MKTTHSDHNQQEYFQYQLRFPDAGSINCTRDPIKGIVWNFQALEVCSSFLGGTKYQVAEYPNWQPFSSRGPSTKNQWSSLRGFWWALIWRNAYMEALFKPTLKQLVAHKKHLQIPSTILFQGHICQGCRISLPPSKTAIWKLILGGHWRSTKNFGALDSDFFAIKFGMVKCAFRFTALALQHLPKSFLHPCTNILQLKVPV